MTDYFSASDEVIENRLGISDPELLKKAEAEISYLHQIEIESEPLPVVYDFDLLLTIHERLFSDLYDFAGKVRQVDIAKGPVPFCYVQNIESEQKRIFGELKKEQFLTGMKREQFAERIAYYATELNALHPFREGNGRTVRLFLRLLAQHAEYRIQYQLCDVGELLHADIAGFNGDLAPLQCIYRRIISEN